MCAPEVPPGVPVLPRSGLLLRASPGADDRFCRKVTNASSRTTGSTARLLSTRLPRKAVHVWQVRGHPFYSHGEPHGLQVSRKPCWTPCTGTRPPVTLIQWYAILVPGRLWLGFSVITITTAIHTTNFKNPGADCERPMMIYRGGGGGCRWAPIPARSAPWKSLHLISRKNHMICNSVLIIAK